MAEGKEGRDKVGQEKGAREKVEFPIRGKKRGEGAEMKGEHKNPKRKTIPRWVGGARGMAALRTARVEFPPEVAIDTGGENPIQSKDKVG